MVYELPKVNFDPENNKVSPYDKLSESMRKVVDYQMETSKDAFDTSGCTWDELRAKYVEERKFWNEGGPEAYKTVEMVVPDGPMGDIPVRIYYPDDKPMHHACIFIHGGGFTVGSVETHNRMMRSVMAASGCAVIGVDYHLAPEAKFPIPLFECAAVTRFFHEQGEQYGILPDHMSLGGDSGGGNLSLATSLLLRDTEGGNDFICALLLYYGTFGLNEGASYRLNGTELDGMRKCDLDYYASSYLDPNRPEDAMDPYYRTIDNDLTHGMPATYLCVGELDPLLDDSRALHQIQLNHGVRSELEVMPGLLHAFMHYGRMMPEAVHCLERSGQFLKEEVNK